ncbi:DMT family transporter [Hymenobacter sp.]|jgi:drug/metabolite transporter (DMT)-like permease|uniref:DMT family transporter n=1 Tax=Hymenobacter sp. TaxID=1898978 RepID=UPI002ED8B3B8
MTTTSKHSISVVGFIVTLVGAVLFSTKAVIVKLAFVSTHANALTLLTLRMLFSLPFYLVAAFVVSSRSSNVKLNNKEWSIVLGLGVIGYYLSSLFDFIGLQYISAGLERLILFLYPTFAVFINAYFFKQTISGVQRVALTLTYAGIALAYFGELALDSSNPNFYYGSFMVFLCAVTYAIYIVGSGKIIPRIGSAKFTAYAMLVATGGIFAHFAVAGETATFQMGKELWIYGILLAVVATVIPSFMLSYGLKSIGSNNVAIISGIGPVSTIMQAYFILGERIVVEQIIGTALVIAGVVLIGWKRKPAAVVEEVAA